MDGILTFFFKSLFVSGLLAFYYWVALRNKPLHRYNRFYLLLSIVMPIVIPFVNLEFYVFDQHLPDSLKILPTEIFPDKSSHSQVYFGLAYIVPAVLMGVSVVLLGTLLYRVVWIYRILNSHSVTRKEGYNLIETNLDQAPFSFMNNLFWRKSISMHDKNGRKMLLHELTHIRERHTYDKLFSQVVLCLFWINPFYWYLIRELNMVHEFVADSKSIKHGDSVSFAEMLLQSYTEGRYLNPSHSFFNSPIKRRLNMISRSKITRFPYMRRLLVLPITMLALIVFSCTKTSRTDAKTVVYTGSTITQMANVEFQKEDGTIGSLVMPVTYSTLPAAVNQARINSGFSTIKADVTVPKKDGTISHVVAEVTYAL